MRSGWVTCSFWRCRKPVCSEKEPGIGNSTLYSCKLDGKVGQNYDRSKDYLSSKLDIICYSSSRGFSWRVSASLTSSFSDQTNGENIYPVVKHSSNGMEFNHINCLVRVLHEAAWSFSLSVESLKLPGSGAELSNAWLGKDVQKWHKVVSYQVLAISLWMWSYQPSLLSTYKHD